MSFHRYGLSPARFSPPAPVRPPVSQTRPLAELPSLVDSFAPSCRHERDWFKKRRLNPTDVYDKLGEIFAGLSFFSLFFVAFLNVKGLYFPSTDDSGSNGSILQDYWW